MSRRTRSSTRAIPVGRGEVLLVGTPDEFELLDATIGSVTLDALERVAISRRLDVAHVVDDVEASRKKLRAAVERSRRTTAERPAAGAAGGRARAAARRPSPRARRGRPS